MVLCCLLFPPNEHFNDRFNSTTLKKLALGLNTGSAFYSTVSPTSQGTTFSKPPVYPPLSGPLPKTSQPSIWLAAMALTDAEMYAIQATERISSVLSLLGAAFVILTFTFNKNFHKPINRLVFYACFGNVMANIGTIISTSGEILGSDSKLCQFQGFLLQMYDQQPSL